MDRKQRDTDISTLKKLRLIIPIYIHFYYTLFWLIILLSMCSNMVMRAMRIHMGPCCTADMIVLYWENSNVIKMTDLGPMNRCRAIFVLNLCIINVYFSLVTIEVLHFQGPPLQRPHQISLLILQVFLWFWKKNLKTRQVSQIVDIQSLYLTIGRLG